jgi:hypothetical protein
MPQISESYASPGLRIGLLHVDHPDAVIDHRPGYGAEVGVPEGWGADRFGVICTITRPGMPDVEAFKPMDLTEKRGQKTVVLTEDDQDPDRWAVLCTKATGRALKKCGYPDDMKDLKALIHWRQRNREIAMIAAGVDTPALEAGDEVTDLDRAGRSTPEAIDPDDGGDDVEEAVIVDDLPSENVDNLQQVIAGRLATLGTRGRTAYRAWATDEWGDDGPQTAHDCQRAVDYLAELET